VCTSSVDQERKENHCFRPQRWLSQLFVSQINPGRSAVRYRFSNSPIFAHVLPPSIGIRFSDRDDNDEVLVAGFGRAGKAKGDIPGVSDFHAVIRLPLQ
jgi:hypothetical protein